MYASIGEETFPLLFDTGTNRSILLDTGENSLPPSLVFSNNPEQTAELDGKPIELVQCGRLQYASSDKVQLGDSGALTIPFRVYKTSAESVSDFRGAFSPLEFSETHIIEVINSKSTIKLSRAENWVHDQESVKLPLLFTPRGVFITLCLDEQPVWFQLDTGYSGNLAITPESRLGSPKQQEASANFVEFRGWGNSFELVPWSMQGYSLSTHDGVFQPANDLSHALNLSEVYLLPENFFDATFIEVVGIVGAQFFAEYDYALDRSLGYMFLWN